MTILLENAKASIELGLEDYRAAQDAEGQQRRILSAIRNFYAGSLLLCKHVLWVTSPPEAEGALAYEEPEPKREDDGNIGWRPPKGKNPKFVGPQKVGERFRSLGIEVDWAKFNALRKIRNDAEHGRFESGLESGRAAIATMCPVVWHLVVKELKQEIGNFFDKNTWDELLKNKNVFDEQQRKCNESFSEIDWGSLAFGAVSGNFHDISDVLTCPECGLALMEQKDSTNKDPQAIEFRCTACQKVQNWKDVVEVILLRALEDEFEWHRDGMVFFPLVECPHCSRWSWVREKGCAFCNLGLLQCGVCRDLKEPVEFSLESGQCIPCAAGWNEKDAP